MVAGLVILGATIAAGVVSACSSSNNNTFEEPITSIVSDAATDVTECMRQCSLDGRSVLDTCSGQVLETCKSEEACGGGMCQSPCAAALADKSSNGCEFYFQPALFNRTLMGQGCYAAYVVNTSATAAELSLEMAGKAIDLSKSVYTTKPGSAERTLHTGPLEPGETAIVFVSDAPQSAPSNEVSWRCPKDVTPALPSGAVLPIGTGVGYSFHLTTNVPVGISTIYPFGGAQSYMPTATLLLPVATWGKEHIIVNAWEQIMLRKSFTGRGPSAQIVASEDETEVTIDPVHDLQDAPGIVGSAAHVPITYVLNKGEVLQINQAEELSGSIVTSTKPTSIFGGHECMYVPSEREACDVAQQQLPPFEQWGSEYVGVGYRPRTGNEREVMPYRIVAARDDTRLVWDPAIPAGAPLTLSAGEMVTFWGTVGDAFVVRTQDADHPIYLGAYMSGSSYPPQGGDPVGLTPFDGHGDPEFVNVIPAGQYLNSYSFYADPTYDDTSLVIVRQKSNGAFKDVWLECAGNVPNFTPIDSKGQYEYARVDLAVNGGPGQKFADSTCMNGLQRMHSEGPFTATLWGWSTYASYAYPGGMAQRQLVKNPLKPVH
ncbi:hypothetical protein AKJ09_04412 [Labilithrix luteola]|uniref:IgGFc-binding protein N-terminal domain-containing protein n=1 Tax=Labilithrix luteola TaxID=1391654 RepID=A0A0K1PW54_9BACT|nr:hypothetical protein AKJ09_04412 [Labilithrix luteola]